MLGLTLVIAGLGSVALLYASYKYLYRRPLPSYPSSLKGKLAIVTGSNTGIGFETALDFACRGARVIVAARNASKGEKAVSEIRQKTGNEGVVFKQLNLASLRSIEEFVATVLKEESRLDILVNNAAVVESDGAKTEDGFEMIMGVNHLGHFHLTNLLLDCLKAAPSARIVCVSSFVSFFRGRFDFDLMKKYDGRKMGITCTSYSHSKLANVLFTRALAERLKGTKVTVNALNPGMVNTQMVEKVNLPKIIQFVAPLAATLFFKTPKQGAETSLYCSLSQDLEGVSGKFFSDCKELVLTREGVTSQEDAERLWEVSTSLINSAKSASN